MSEITNPTTPLSAVDNGDGGLFIQGFEDQENRLNGTENNDIIIGGNSDDLLFGLGGNDVIDGDFGGADLLDGGEGNDVVSGLDADTLVGGAGNDSFIFNISVPNTDGISQIEDYVIGEDSLGIVGLDPSSNVDYDRSTGVISVNGQPIANIGRERSISDRDLDFDSLDFDNNDLTNAGEDFSVGSGTEGVADVFALSQDALNSGRIIAIDGFVSGEDTIQLEGISSGDNIDYDRSTGILNLNGESFAQIGREQSFDESRDINPV